VVICMGLSILLQRFTCIHSWTFVCEFVYVRLYCRSSTVARGKMEGVRSSSDVGSKLSSPFVVGVTPGKVPAVYSVRSGRTLTSTLGWITVSPHKGFPF
jgi:hypothetical protein